MDFCYLLYSGVTSPPYFNLISFRLQAAAAAGDESAAISADLAASMETMTRRNRLRKLVCCLSNQPHSIPGLLGLFQVPSCSLTDIGLIHLKLFTSS